MKKMLILAAVCIFGVLLAFYSRPGGNRRIGSGIIRYAAYVAQHAEKLQNSVEEGARAQKDYPGSIAVIDVEKPIERTKTEAIQKLRVLEQEYPVIEEITKNISLYPENMLKALANNPEMADFVAGYPDREKFAAAGLTELEKEEEYPLFLQWDPRWGYQPYGDDSCIGLAGCGPACLSMVLYYLTGDETLTPDALASYAMKNGYYAEGHGTAWSFMEDVPGKYGIGVQSVKAMESAMKAELDSGGIIICSMREGDFTATGHFIVVYGYDNGGFQVNDPNCVARSRKRWTFGQLEKQIKSIWSYRKKNEKHGGGAVIYDEQGTNTYKAVERR